jgi:hypothetical protein
MVVKTGLSPMEAAREFPTKASVPQAAASILQHQKLALEIRFDNARAVFSDGDIPSDESNWREASPNLKLIGGKELGDWKRHGRALIGATPLR